MKHHSYRPPTKQQHSLLRSTYACQLLFHGDDFPSDEPMLYEHELELLDYKEGTLNVSS